jgi:hypothetical protein
MNEREWASAVYMEEAKQKLRDALDLLVRAHPAKAEQGEQDRQQVRQSEAWETLAHHQREKRGENVGVAKGSAANPANKGTPASDEQRRACGFNFIDVKLPQDLLQLPVGFHLCQFQFCSGGSVRVWYKAVNKGANRIEDGEEGHFD